MKWYIIFSKHGNTPTVTRKLISKHLKKGCSLYVPSYYKFNKYHKSKINKNSLYPFYIFVGCPDENTALELEKNLGTRFGYLLKGADGTPRALTGEQILKIKRQEEDISAKQLEISRPIEVGDEVEVTYGPLLGLKKSVVGVTTDYIYVQVTTTTSKTVQIPLKYEDVKRA